MKVVIVGGGLTGAYAAFLLARSGADVICIDPAYTPGRASDVNPGGLNPLHGPGIPGPVSTFALYCHQLHLSEWDSIHQLSGIHFQPRVVTRLLLGFSTEEVDALAAPEKLYRENIGFSARRLNARELQELPQDINPAALGGLLTRGNASVNSALYTHALLKGAQKLGAALVTGRVDNIHYQGRKITGVQVGQGRFTADHVVFCTGPHTGELHELLGESIPVRAVKGELLVAELDEHVYRHDVTWHQFGLYHAGGNRFWLGGTREDSGLDVGITEGAATAILAGIRQLMPSFSKSAIVDQQCGLRPMSPDGLPVLGRLRNWDNGYIANGGGAKGVLFSAGMAQTITRLITEGHESADLAIFSPYRFSVPGGSKNA